MITEERTGQSPNSGLDGRQTQIRESHLVTYAD